MGGVILLLLSLLCTIDGVAQTTTTTKERWHGTTIENLKASTLETKDGNTTGNIAEQGDVFYLYNVGTGKFVTAGGEFGLEAYLDYKDFGAAMTLGCSGAVGEGKLKNLIFSGIEGKVDGKYDDDYPLSFGVNYPNITSEGTSWTDHKTQCIGVLLNASPEAVWGTGGKWYHRDFTFERVEKDANSTTVTYRIKERLRYGKGDDEEFHYVYLGAKAGMDVNTGKDMQAISGNRVTFTEVKKENDTNWLVSNTNLYSWRLVTVEEMKEVAKAENADNYGGAVANVSFLVKDPFFDPSRTSEYKTWKTEQNGEYESYTNGQYTEKTSWVDKDYKKTYYNTFRYVWNNGDTASVSVVEMGTANEYSQYGDRGMSIASFTETPGWDTPVLRKIHFASIENGKYGFAMLDGKAKAYNSVTIPDDMGGYYMVTCRGVADHNNVTLYATGNGETQSADFKTKTYGDKLEKHKDEVEDGDVEVNEYFNNTSKPGLFSGDYDPYEWKWESGSRSGSWYRIHSDLYSVNGTTLLGIADDLYYHGDDYTVTVIVKADAKSTLTYGVQKDGATKSDVIVRKYQHYGKRTGSWDTDKNIDDMRVDSYYYDKDIAAFDNVQIYYLGKTAPFVLDESKEKEGEGYIDEEFAEKGADGKARNGNVTTYLKRSLSPSVWTSIVLPVNMTAEQVLNYFGEGTKLAKLDGANSISTNVSKYMIDFRSQPLTETVKDETSGTTVEQAVNKTVIEAGKFYIIKPSKEPSDRCKYTMASNDGKTETTTEVDVKDCYMIGMHNFSGDVPEHKDEVKTNDNGTITFHGTYYYLQNTDDDAPQAGSYVLSGGKMYHITSNIAQRGLSGWLTAVGPDGKAKKMTFNFGGDTTTTIDGVTEDDNVENGNVYTLGGQLVRTNSNSLVGLPKGVYIVNGKKVVLR